MIKGVRRKTSNHGGTTRHGNGKSSVISLSTRRLNNLGVTKDDTRNRTSLNLLSRNGGYYRRRGSRRQHCRHRPLNLTTRRHSNITSPQRNEMLLNRATNSVPRQILRGMKRASHKSRCQRTQHDTRKLMNSLFRYSTRRCHYRRRRQSKGNRQGKDDDMRRRGANCNGSVTINGISRTRSTMRRHMTGNSRYVLTTRQSAYRRVKRGLYDRGKSPPFLAAFGGVGSSDRLPRKTGPTKELRGNSLIRKTNGAIEH